MALTGLACVESDTYIRYNCGASGRVTSISELGGSDETKASRFAGKSVSLLRAGAFTHPDIIAHIANATVMQDISVTIFLVIFIVIHIPFTLLKHK